MAATDEQDGWWVMLEDVRDLDNGDTAHDADETWYRQSAGALFQRWREYVTTAILLYAAGVFAASVAIGGIGGGVLGLLYVFPVCATAILLGLRGGLLAGVAAAGLTVLEMAVTGPAFRVADYVYVVIIAVFFPLVAALLSIWRDLPMNTVIRNTIVFPVALLGALSGGVTGASSPTVPPRQTTEVWQDEELEETEERARAANAEDIELLFDGMDLTEAIREQAKEAAESIERIFEAAEEDRKREGRGEGRGVN